MGKSPTSPFHCPTNGTYLPHHLSVLMIQQLLYLLLYLKYFYTYMNIIFVYLYAFFVLWLMAVVPRLGLLEGFWRITRRIVEPISYNFPMHRDPYHLGKFSERTIANTLNACQILLFTASLDSESPNTQEQNISFLDEPSSDGTTGIVPSSPIST